MQDHIHGYVILILFFFTCIIIFYLSLYLYNCIVHISLCLRKLKLAIRAAIIILLNCKVYVWHKEPIWGGMMKISGPNKQHNTKFCIGIYRDQIFNMCTNENWNLRNYMFISIIIRCTDYHYFLHFIFLLCSGLPHS